MAVRRRVDEFTGKNLPEFPYPYGTGLHWLWGWGQRVEANLDRERFQPSTHDWIFHRADEPAANAMLEFSIEYPSLVEEIRRCQRDVENRWDEVLDNENDESRFAYCDSLYVLYRRIHKVCEFIAAESNTKAVEVNQTEEKKIKPTGKTVEIIRAIQSGKDNNGVVEATGSSVANVRKVRCKLEKGCYEI